MKNERMTQLAGQQPGLLSLGFCSRQLWTVALLLTAIPFAPAQQNQTSGSMAPLPGVVAQWDFHLGPSHDVVEQIGGKRTHITGTIYPVPGPVGEALLFDGYTSALHGESPDVLDHPSNKTIACWLQLDAYPWNQLPILDRRDGLFFGLDAEGHLLIRIGDRFTGKSVASTSAVPLRTWTFVTVAIDGQNRITFTIGGRPSPSRALEFPRQESGVDTSAIGGDLLIGHVRRPLLPGPPSMIHPQLPIEYSLQGSLGGLAVYGRVLSSSDIDALLAKADKRLLAATPWPKFPRGESGQQRFGASSTRRFISLDPVWDRSRRVGPDSDVVVRFDDAPIQLVFWQGNNYVPAWVTENNRWYTDEFMEVYGHPRCPDGEDCEPMSDKQVRYSHVRILEESTPARVIVQWRYALSGSRKIRASPIHRRQETGETGRTSIGRSILTAWR